jgi:tryptophan-rich sensory protein
MRAYFVQLALNLTWSFVFFGVRSPAVSLAVIVLLLVAIVATILGSLCSPLLEERYLATQSGLAAPTV